MPRRRSGFRRRCHCAAPFAFSLQLFLRARTLSRWSRSRGLRERPSGKDRLRTPPRGPLRRIGTGRRRSVAPAPGGGGATNPHGKTYTFVEVPRMFRSLLAAPVALGLSLVLAVGARADVITPPGLNPGDQFRIVFVTNTLTPATSSIIGDYDAIVAAD